MITKIAKDMYYVETLNNEIMDILKDSSPCTIFYRYEEADIEIWRELYTKLREIEFIQTKNVFNYLEINKLC